MEHNQLILSAKDVNIQFNLRGKVLHAIRGIDLDLYQGEVLAIVGESGSGKSVFTKSFMGLLDANGSITSGTIDYYGMAEGAPLRLSDIRTEKDWLRVRGREIAMIMQDPRRERQKKLLVYDPAMHDYSREAPQWRELRPAHFVLCSAAEAEQWLPR